MQLLFCWDSASIKYVALPFADTERYYRYRSLPASLGLVFPSSQEFHRVSSSFSIRVLSVREVHQKGSLLSSFIFLVTG